MRERKKDALNCYLSVHRILQTPSSPPQSAAPKSRVAPCLQDRLGNEVSASPVSAVKENPVEGGWNE